MSGIGVLGQTYYYTASPLWTIGQLVVGLTVLAGGIYAVVDASKYEDWVWSGAGQNKVLWQILLIVVPLLGCLCCFFLGIIPVALYFLWVKKQLDAARGNGPGAGAGGPYGYPTGGPGAPGGYPPAAPDPYGYPPGYGTPPDPYPGWGEQAPPPAPPAPQPPPGGASPPESGLPPGWLPPDPGAPPPS